MKMFVLIALSPFVGVLSVKLMAVYLSMIYPNIPTAESYVVSAGLIAMTIVLGIGYQAIRSVD